MANSTTRRINIYVNGQEVENKIGGVEAAYKRLGRELKQLEIGSDAYNKKAMEIQKLKAVIDEHNVAIGKTASGWDKIKDNLISTGFGVLGGNFLTALTTKIAGFFGGMIDGSAKLSDQFADIQKTTGMTADEVEALNKELKGIDTRTSVSDLREMAIVAGQLGIAKEDVKGFADSIDKINVALGDEIQGGAGVVAETVGKLRNVMIDMKSDAVDQDLLKIGNALNELGAAGFATAPVVSDFTNRIGSIAIPLGMSSAQVMGLSATLQELNVSTERGGTAVGRILKQMTTDTASFASIAGMDVKSFTNMVNTDLYGAFMKVVEGSRKGGTSATAMSAIIKDLEVDGAGASEVFMKLSGNVEMTNEKVELAGKALQNTDSILNEFNLKNNNFAGIIAKSGKDISGYFAGIGQKIAPTIAALIKGFADFLGWVKRNGDAVLFLGKGLLVAGTAYVSYNAAIRLAALLTREKTGATILDTIAEKASMVIQKANTAMLYLKLVALDLYKGKITLATAATEAFNLVTKASPVGLMIAGVTTLATAFMLFKNNAKEVSEEQKRINKAIVDAKSPMQQEQAEVNLLVNRIMQLNEGNAERKKLLENLAKNYPDFLGSLDKENVTNKQLADQLLKVNDQYREKIKLAATAAEREEIMKTAVENQRKRMEAELQLSDLNDKMSKNSDPVMANVYKAQKANLEMILSATTSVAKNTEQKLQNLDKISNEIAKKLGTDPVSGKQEGTGTAAAAPTDEEKKAIEDFNKQMEKLREDRNQSYMDADEKELRQIDLKYQELIEKAKKAGQSTAEIEKMWDEEITQTKQKQIGKWAEITNKANEDYIAELDKNKQDEMKRLEDSLKESGKLKLTQLKQDYVDGKITKKQFEDKEKELEIAQLSMLIELRKQYGLDVTDLETEMLDKFVAIANEKDKSTKIPNFFDKLFNTDKAKEKIQAISDMVGEVSNIWGSLLQIQSNKEEQELRNFRKGQEDKKKLLDKRLKSGLISQTQYDEQVKQLDAETEKREKKAAYEAAKREKTFATFSAIINTIQGVTKALSAAPPPFNFVLAALTAAAGAVQVAAIQSQPLPELAAGGYTEGVSIAGEAGTEWVASNSLLKDKKTAPVISWLENYQRGNRSMSMPAIPNFDMISNAVQNRTNTNTTAGNKTIVQSDPEVKMLLAKMIDHQKKNIEETQKLNTYLSDPDNRKARIVRDELTRFDKEMSTLQGLARIGK